MKPKTNDLGNTKAAQANMDAIAQDHDAYEQALRFEGWCQCLNSVRASISMYPNGGGDIEIMERIQQIEQEAYNRGLDEGIGNSG